jgi:DNA helicase-2/ATP-dependent DNA helicase PcrA
MDIVIIESTNLIAPKLSQHYRMNDAQIKIISHKRGPLRVVAGPGSGKTYSLTLLAMNLLLCEDTPAEGIILCTYTDRASYEIQDRLSDIAHKIDYQGDLSNIKIGTIHSICKQLINRHLDHTPLGNSYETLDQFSQRLLIYRSLTKLCGAHMLAFLKTEWETEWQVAKKLQFLLDKIAEELIAEKLLEQFPKPLIDEASNKNTIASFLPLIYQRYREILAEGNYVDFAHLQKYAYDLLQEPDVFKMIASDIRYVLVDEYQDTNYIQEKILSSLASATEANNLCVVGDEDQALYRFRGATVRNILEFPQTFEHCSDIQLTINYRSHAAIIETCNQWMNALAVSLPKTGISSTTIFRTEKMIQAAPSDTPLEASMKAQSKHPAVITLTARDIYDEAEQVAQLVVDLKKNGKIQDYSQVALLLHSVRSTYSGPYVEAFNKQNIAVYCPRAREYFQQPEIQLLIGSFTQILHFHAADLTDEQGNFSEYLEQCQQLFIQYSQEHSDLKAELRAIEQEMQSEEEQKDAPDKQLADYFYRLLATDAFEPFRTEKLALSNLVLFSEYLKIFLTSFQYLSISDKNLCAIQYDFFHTFLYLLHMDGVNQPENPEDLVPEDHIQIMTIHQAKGLEFSVVIVGRLDRNPSLGNSTDRLIQEYYHRPQSEPEKHIPAFDLRRLFYVAFSRAKQLLVLSAPKEPHPQFRALCQSVPALEYNYSAVMDMPAAEPHQRHTPPKRRFSLTGHITRYETCPRQFEFLREYGFQPAHAANTFYGQLIHQTLEAIHRIALERSLETLDDKKLEYLFDRTFYFLTCTGLTPLDKTLRQKARTQIFRYVDQNQDELNNIQDAEYSFQVENDAYILTGTMDLLLQSKNGFEIIDFKTGPRPDPDAAILARYKQQLYLYAYALERRTGQLPERLSLYWTDEKHKEDARMAIPYQEEDIRQVSNYFDTISQQILQKHFDVVTPPEPTICQGCDIRYLCTKEGIITQS